MWLAVCCRCSTQVSKLSKASQSGELAEFVAKDVDRVAGIDGAGDFANDVAKIKLSALIN